MTDNLSFNVYRENSFRVTPPSVNDVVDQCKSLYKKKSSPVKVTLLCSKQTGSLFTGTLATHLARFSQIEVTVVIREGDSFCHRWLKEDSEMFGYRLLESKKQSDFDDPLDCLLFPPLAFKTDIVVGVGRELGKTAQLWKELYQCKSVCMDGSLDILSDVMELTRELQSERQHRHKIRLREADLVVATGCKMSEELSRDLDYDNKEVFNLTPGIFIDFCDVCHGVGDATRSKFHVLFVGSDDPNCFEKERFDIAAKAVAENGKSYRLTYVGAGRNRSKLTKKFRHCGVAETQLDFQSLPKRAEDWKRLLSRVDLAIMPSSQKEFGLEALLALSAGLPVLVNADSGFGEALKEVKMGTSAIVDSDDAAVWAQEIRKVRETDRKKRLEQATMLRAFYDEMYSWEKQCGELVNRMVKMVSA